MSLISEIEVIKNEIRAAQGSLESESATSIKLYRIELDGVWKALDAIAAKIDGDKAALGF
jgi:hypothetical protein